MKCLAVFVLAAAATAAHAAPATLTGTWKVAGDVQGVPVNLTCALLEADHKITGTCTDGSDGKSHDVVGTLADSTVTFHFSSTYQGTAITVGFQGTLDAAGAKVTGNIAVPEFNADGDFTASRQATSTN